MQGKGLRLRVSLLGRLIGALLGEYVLRQCHLVFPTANHVPCLAANSPSWQFELLASVNPGRSDMSLGSRQVDIPPNWVNLVRCWV